MHPSREQSEAWIAWAEGLNPGPWGDHVRTCARAAEAIARASGLEAERAWHMGLLHDIGRYEGVTGLRHAVAGHDFLNQRGYGHLARICLTHSFPVGDVRREYFGAYDVEDADIQRIEAAIADADEYDRLIQLCDAIALPQGVCLMEKRLVDVAMRHGFPPGIGEKWRSLFAIKAHFETRMGRPIYTLFEEAANVTFA